MIDDAPANRKTFKTDTASWFDWFFPDVPAAVAQGRLPAKFSGLDEVGEWVRGHGQSGEPALRMFLISPAFDEESKRFASVWLQQAEADRVDLRAQEHLKVARDAAGAAAKSANWTMYAAIASAVGSLAAMIGVAVTAFADPPEPKVYLLDTAVKAVGSPSPLPLSRASTVAAPAASKSSAPIPTQPPGSTPR